MGAAGRSLSEGRAKARQPHNRCTIRPIGSFYRGAPDIDAGILPEHFDAHMPARYVGTVMQGMSQAAGDAASWAELEKVAELAMRGWGG
ncbi:hypothetical protein OHB12_20375 [Nocardia sp. NBC_01730]|uniref:hypothetical protein n=1 Tax=Nocardia sp. NBC_01730 TaxID=2975998 RepID=UPI002E103BC5|nr:hypothetical protein OHB12_20375 [Nocardia sp. NBC_01730]